MGAEWLKQRRRSEGNLVHSPSRDASRGALPGTCLPPREPQTGLSQWHLNQRLARVHIPSPRPRRLCSGRSDQAVRLPADLPTPRRCCQEDFDPPELPREQGCSWGADLGAGGAPAWEAFVVLPVSRGAPRRPCCRTLPVCPSLLFHFGILLGKRKPHQGGWRSMFDPSHPRSGVLDRLTRVSGCRRDPLPGGTHPVSLW